MPLPFLRRRAVPLAAVMVCAAAMATAFFMLSLYLQQVRGLSPLQTSTAFLLPIPAVATSGPLAARLIPRLGARPVLATGLLTAAGGLLLVSLLGVPYAGLLVFPFGTGLAFSAAMVAAVQDVAPEQAGLAGALVNTAMETGPPLGLAVLVWIATAYSRHPAAGYPFALRTAAVLLLVTAVITTMSRHAFQPEEKDL
jgi:predicted MFS family arabinose efflux permease